MPEDRFTYDTLVKRGSERGRITGIVNDKQIRVFWYNGLNMYHETINIDEVELDDYEPLKVVKED